MQLKAVPGNGVADTRVQLQVEDWVRSTWMKQHFRQPFFRERIKLRSGGVFDADAVSSDGSIAAVISTSGARTSGGKYAVGKMHKIRSDMYFLLLAEVQRRVVVLTERDMYDQWVKESSGGRVAQGFGFVHAELPKELNEKLVGARLVASGESGKQ